MLHHMKLAPSPFLAMASGKKTIELRLFDEKRQKLQVGDHICFTNTEDAFAVCMTRVTGLHRFDTFADLYRTLPLAACGYTQPETAAPQDMYAYYTPEAEQNFGVVGIEVTLATETHSALAAVAVELQSLAQAGLFYTKDKFDRERFVRIREIAAELLVTCTDCEVQKISDIFCADEGYQTPKLDTRAAVISGGKILLVQEADSGLWTLPGGWCEVTCSLAENAEKEAREEAGAVVRAKRLVAVQYRDKHPFLPSVQKICKTLVLCELLSFDFQQNSETTAAAFFAPDTLPPLDLTRTIPSQIAMAFAANESKTWETVFD